MARKKTPDILGIALSGKTHSSSVKSDFNDGQLSNETLTRGQIKDMIEEAVLRVVCDVSKLDDAVRSTKEKLSEIEKKLSDLSSDKSDVSQNEANHLCIRPYIEGVEPHAQIPPVTSSESVVEPDNEIDEADILNNESPEQASIKRDPSGFTAAYHKAVTQTIEKMRTKEGLTLDQIAKRLQNGGLKNLFTNQKWTVETIQKILDSAY